MHFNCFTTKSSSNFKMVFNESTAKLLVFSTLGFGGEECYSNSTQYDYIVVFEIDFAIADLSSVFL